MADTSGELPQLRVGYAERQAAMRALDVHVEAGRLTIDEYGDRSAVASMATHVSDLTALFADLPAPHPPLPRRAGEEPVPAPRPAHEVYARPADRERSPERDSDAATPVALGLLMMLVLALPALMLLGAAGGAVGGTVLFLPLLFLLAGSVGRHHRRGRDE